MPTLDSILKDALSLPVQDRGRLIKTLIDSLDEGEDDSTAEDALAEVVARRIADLDAGRARIIDAKTAFAEGRAELRRQRRG